MSIELKVNDFLVPSAIDFNYEQLKSEIQRRADMYHGITYTDDQVKEAKSDLATLRKFMKAMDDERIRVKKEVLKPYNGFETKIKELTNIVEKAEKEIQKQVENFEQARKQEKNDKCLDIFYSVVERPEWLDYELIFDRKWLNASTSLASIQKAIKEKIEKINKDHAMLEELPEFGFEAATVYEQTLDMNKAYSEAKRMAEIQRQKAALEKAKAERDAEMQKHKADVLKIAAEAQKQSEQKPKDLDNKDNKKDNNRQWIGFKAYISVNEAMALNRFFTGNGIQFEQIEL